MKKTNFFKLFLVGAVALTLGFSSCQDTVSQKDFEAVCKDIDLLKTDVDQLKKDLAALGTVVRDVKPHATDPTKLTVTYTNGNSADITIPAGPKGDKGDKGDQGDQGPKGDPGTGGGGSATSFITINDAGNWVIDGVDTGAKASELAPRINTTTDNHFWEFPVVNAENKIEWVAGPAVIAAAYAVETDGEWILYLPTADHTELQDIHLVKENGSGTGSNGGLNKIDILGWVEDFEATDNLSVKLAEDGELIDGEGNPANATDVLKGELYDLTTDTFVVYYNVIDKYTGDNNGTSQPAVTPTDPPVYSPYTGAAAPAIYNAVATAGYNFGSLPRALTTLGSQDKGFIVQGHGSTLSDYTFVLEDSQKNQLPIAFEKPVLISGLLTRTAANSDLWFIEGKDEVPGTFANDKAFAGKFAPEALYTLVADTGFRSEYTPFTITPTLVSSLEAQVTSVDEKELQPAVGDVDPSFYAQVGVVNELTFDKTYFFEDNAYTLYPNDTRHTAEIGGADPYLTDTADNIVANGVETQRYTNAVVDWYIKVGSNDELGSETYITTQFDITFNEDHTTFTIGQLPDGLTEASFNMDVYKLGIDGVVYYERLRIHPTRVEIITEINLGEYTVEDGFPGMSGDVATDYLGSVLRIPKTTTSPQSEGLDKMFADLKAHPDYPSSDMEQRWKDDEYGAMTYTITNVSIEGKTDAQNAGKGFLGRFMFPYYVEKGAATSALTTEYNGSTVNTTAASDATENPVLGINTYNAVTTDAYTTYGQGPDQAGATASAFLAVGDNGKYLSASATPFALYDARSFEIYPNYSYSDGVATTGVDRNGDGTIDTSDDPSFEINKKHTVTVEFFDKNGMKLNTIKVMFTPVLPELNTIFKREPQYWVDVNKNGNILDAEDVLNAYYKAPDNWYDAKFWGMNATGTATNATLSSQVTGTIAPAVADENMTFYNVYNPGGTTTLKHAYNHPLDGGYNKIGLRTEEDKQWAATVNLALQDPTMTIDNVTSPIGKLLNFLPQTAFGADPLINGMEGATSVIALYNQTNPYSGAAGTANYADNFTGLAKADSPNAYGGKNTDDTYPDALPMVWNLSPYIDFYKITSTEKFKLRVMSALAEGKLLSTNAAVDDAAPANGGFLKLTDEHITLENYNHNKFSVFQRWNPDTSKADYAYTYIYNVVFTRPVGVSVYDIMTPDLVAADGTWTQANEGGVAIAPAATGETGYLALKPMNISTTANTTIDVMVYDRFGRTLKGTVDITLDVRALQQ